MFHGFMNDPVPILPVRTKYKFSRKFSAELPLRNPIERHGGETRVHTARHDLLLGVPFAYFLKRKLVWLVTERSGMTVCRDGFIGS
jgi:hypothetical protein